MEIQYWISPHEHPLRLRDDAINDQFTCQTCSRSVSGAPFYFCDSCSGFYLHKSCAKLPDEIQHPFHPHSLLSLDPKCSISCDSCHRDFEDSPFYSCSFPCEIMTLFNLDSECALMPLTPSGSEGRDWIRQGSHPHPLLHIDDRPIADIKCVACKSTCRDQTYYGCFRCDYFLDKSCARLPRQIHHPLHHNHRSALVLRSTESFICHLCSTYMEDRHNLGFSCYRCLFWMCLRCAEPAISAMKRGNIKYEDHEHLLCVVENVRSGTNTKLSQCDGYDLYCTNPIVTCSDEFKRNESTMLWCFDCNFRVHLLCGPLPSIIKHTCHVDPLILIDSLAEDDSGEYFCDVCEGERDPRIRLYCCHECKYFAHVHCVITEIVKILSGDLKDVEYKTVGQDFWKVSGRDRLKVEDVNRSLTLKDVIKEMSEGEKKLIRRFYDNDNSDDNDEDEDDDDENDNNEDEDEDDNIDNSSSSKNVKLRDDEINDILQLSRFTDGSFKSFCSDLQHYYKNNKLKLKSSDLALKIVRVKSYMIPHSLAAVLNKLLYKFGDIAIGSRKSARFKGFVLFLVCKVVKGMFSTMPKCITKNLLQEWYYYLRFARRCGFEIDFACSQFEQLVHAFLGFQAKRLKHEIPTILAEKIDELERKSNSVQRKLDTCKEYRGSSPKSKYMEYCLSKASEFEWNDALGDSLTQKRTEPSPWFGSSFVAW